MTGIQGIHHVTAVARRPQRNVNFYAGLLGLRLVKRTVNYEDPRSYHLYYGGATGSPGTLITFFPWGEAPGGRIGSGQAAVTAFSVLPSSIGFWVERLIRHGVAFTGPTIRDALGTAAERVLAFTDDDGLLLEIVGDPAAESRPGWNGAAGVPAEHAIRGLHGVALWVDRMEPTERLLVDVLGLHPLRNDASTRRFTAGADGPGSIVDLRAIGGFGEGTEGPGTVHHIAWTVENPTAQLVLRERLVAASIHPTDVLDRTYFQSVYFQEPGRIFFELATAVPGFLVDEPEELLGERLMLPPWLERDRPTIESILPPVHIPRPHSAESMFRDLPPPG